MDGTDTTGELPVVEVEEVAEEEAELPDAESVMVGAAEEESIAPLLAAGTFPDEAPEG